MAAGTLVSSGSSLNMPTGSGSERLRRASIHALNDGTQEILSGTAGHIYTIISIIFCDQQNASGLIAIRVNDGTNNIQLLADQAHGAKETFVFSDRFVMTDGCKLQISRETSAGTYDSTVSYILQDWT